MTDRTVLALLEVHDGAITNHSLEVANVAGDLDRELSLGLIGAGAMSSAGVLPAFNGKLFVADDRELDPFVSGSWTAAAEAIVRAASPNVVVAPGSIAGRDYVPRLSARLGVPLISDATSVRLADGVVSARRYVYGGRFQADVRPTTDQPVVITLQPGFCSPAELRPFEGEAEAVSFAVDDANAGVELVEVAEQVSEGQQLTDADLIVSGGRGLQNADNFALIEDLASAMDAAVGASGAVVGQGWRSHDDQVGSTGYTVSPELYLAVGISGAPQHIYGMRGSKYVAAINRDASAPIFQIADFGIVGDLFQIVPEITRQLKDGS